MDNGLVVITDKCRKKKEHSVLCHEGFGQSVPPETIVHIIEDTFLSSTKVIELDNFSCGRFIVVSQDTTVCVFSFPKIQHTVHPFLSLNHKSVCFTLPLLNKNRVQFELNAIDFLSLPASKSKDVIVERTAAVCADIEGFAVFLLYHHCSHGTCTKTVSKPIDFKPFLIKPNKEPLQCVLQKKTNVGFPIAILNANNQVVNTRHARAITKELLVCRLCIILLSLYELMVEINIIHLALFQLAGCKHTIEQ